MLRIHLSAVLIKYPVGHHGDMGITAGQGRSAGSYWMRLVGLVSVVLASVLFLAGLLAYVFITEVAFLALIFAFGAATFGTGALAAARRM
jgi:hypothetical protein